MKIREIDLKNINKIGIYCITNLVNGKKYIGQTGCKKGFNGRWNAHKNDFKRKPHSNFLIYRAFNKYGIDNFEFSILEIVEPIEDKKKLNQILNEKEMYWVLYYDSNNPNHGYNMTKGGEGTLGLKPWNKGLFGSNNPQKYSIHTKEHNKKISNSLKKHYELNESLVKGKNNISSIPIKLTDLKSNIILEFDCMRECIDYINKEENIKVNRNSFSKHVKNKSNQPFLNRYLIIYNSNKKIKIISENQKRQISKTLKDKKINTKPVIMSIVNSNITKRFYSAKECAEFINSNENTIYRSQYIGRYCNGKMKNNLLNKYILNWEER